MKERSLVKLNPDKYYGKWPFRRVFGIQDLTEVYRIIYDGPADVLRGIISTNDSEVGTQLLLNDREIEENGYQILFEELDLDEIHDLSRMMMCYSIFPEVANRKLSATNKPRIERGDHILLKCPGEASIGGSFGIQFDLFGVCNEWKEIVFPYGEPELQCIPQRKVILGDKGDRRFTVLYAMFGNAGEAHVKVKFTKMNSAAAAAFHVYGIVTARTSAINEPNYSSIIFFKDKDCEKLIVGPGDEMILPLSRPFVAAPDGSELILEFNLASDDNDTLVQDIVSFKVTEGVTSAELVTIICSKFVMEVEVSWRWIKKLDMKP